MFFLKVLFTTLIFFTPETYATISSGTGFFVGKNGIVATNFHVIKDAKSVSLRLSDGKIVDAIVIKKDLKNDLALLKTKNTIKNPLKITSSKNIAKGEKVYALGFPHIQLQGLEPKLTDGIISSLSGIGNDKRVYQITNPIQPGNSGGPLFTEDGKVIGIIVASINSIAVARETGSIPQNVNYAIKSQYLIDMIGTNSSEKEKKYLTKDKKFTEIVKEIEKSVVIVLIRK